jgi:hypothetical protein
MMASASRPYEFRTKCPLHRHGARLDHAAGSTATLQLDSDDDPKLHWLKQAAADLIDLCQAIPSSPDGEANALAQTAVEEASLHSVVTARSDGG